MMTARLRTLLKGYVGVLLWVHVHNMFDNNQYHQSVPDAFKKKDRDHVIFYVDEIQRYRSLKLEMPENSDGPLFSKCGLCYVNNGGMKVVAFIAIIRCIRRGSNFEMHRPRSILCEWVSPSSQPYMLV
jgi:hypothetical protein